VVEKRENYVGKKSMFWDYRQRPGGKDKWQVKRTGVCDTETHGTIRGQGNRQKKINQQPSDGAGTFGDSEGGHEAPKVRNHKPLVRGPWGRTKGRWESGGPHDSNGEREQNIKREEPNHMLNRHVGKKHARGTEKNACKL